MPSPRDKRQKMEDVAEGTLRLIQIHGLIGLSVAAIARTAQVSRPWLYKYVGKNKDSLIEYATRHFGTALAGLHSRPRTDSKEHWIEDSLDGMRKLFRESQRYPWMLPLYYRYKGSPTALGRSIAEIERRYIEAATLELATISKLPEPQARLRAETLIAIRLGIAHRQLVDGYLDELSEDHFYALLRSWVETL